MPRPQRWLAGDAAVAMDAGRKGQFVLYDFDGAPSIVLLAHHRTGAFVVEPNDVADYKTAVDKIRRLAMSPADSRTLITRTAHELEAAR